MINGFDDIDYLQNIKKSNRICRHSTLLENQ
jgi:hypothetical protein